MTRTMYDAAYPPPDPHLDVCAFYIGGDTPHVWSDSEIAAQSARWRLPIYVCSDPGTRNPTSDSATALAWLRAHGVPAGSTLALDYETAVDSAYVTAFDKELVAAGWQLLLYGSQTSVTQNQRPSAGYWTASWTGVAHLDSGAAATQWASDTMLGKPYDLSEVADSLVLWDTQGVPQMEQTDKVIGNLSRGNTVGDVLADLSNFRDEFYLAPGTDSNNPPAAGSRLDVLFSQLADIQTKVGAIAVPDPNAIAAALASNSAAMTQIADAVAAKLPAAPTADQIAAAVAAHFSNDLKTG